MSSYPVPGHENLEWREAGYVGGLDLDALFRDDAPSKIKLNVSELLASLLLCATISANTRVL